MDTNVVVMLGQLMLQEVIILAGPILGVAIVVSLIVNVLQTLTSLQDNTVSTVTRLLVTGGALFFMMPWMWRHLAQYTLGLLSDFKAILG